jgi:hypothetical protein
LPVSILRNAMLCNAASVEQSGLVSMLGAFIDRLAGPQLPVRGQLWLVARFDWEDADLDAQHMITIKIERVDDGEQVARIDGSVVGERPVPGTFDPEMPVGWNIVLPVPAEFRRVGLHRVSLSLDAEVRWDVLLKVETQLPQV